MIVSKHKIVVAKTRATTAMKSVNHVTTLVTTTPTAIRHSAISRPAITHHNATLQHVLSASKATMTTARTVANVHHAKPAKNVQHALSVPSAMSVQHVNCVQHVKHLNCVMRATPQHQSKHQPMKNLVQHATRATTVKTMSALFVLNVKSVRRTLNRTPMLTLKNLM